MFDFSQYYTPLYDCDTQLVKLILERKCAKSEISVFSSLKKQKSPVNSILLLSFGVVSVFIK